MHEHERDGLAEELNLRAQAAAAPARNVAAALEQLTATIVELGIADGVGVTERSQGTFNALAATDERIRAVDLAQAELNEGPCVQAVYDNGLQVSGDLATEQRWPRWGAIATENGIRAVISVNLYTVGTAIGALNLFSEEPRAYTSDDLDTARVLGAHASVVLARYHSDSNLWKAIDGRHRIGMAQGRLMEKYGFTEEQSFAVLRRSSQQENTKLNIIADHIVSTGRLPESGMTAGPDTSAGTASQ